MSEEQSTIDSIQITKILINEIALEGLQGSVLMHLKITFVYFVFLYLIKDAH